MSTELINKIKKDLEKSGFGSEMEARQALISRGWSVDAGNAYLDPDENKSREIDFIATKVHNLTHQDKVYTYSEFHICGEVKKSEKPWVVFEQKTHKALLSCAWNNLITYQNLPCEPTKLVKYLVAHSPIKNLGWLAGGLHESFKKPDQPSRWYSAFVSVAKASEFYISKMSRKTEKQTDNIIENPCEIHFAQPVIILDGRLFKAALDADSECEVSEIDSASFRFSYRSKDNKRDSYRVDVVTMAGLNKYTELIEKRQKFFCKGIEQAAGLAPNN